MLTLFEQIDKGNLWQSHGGIHPPELKNLSNTTPIQKLPLAKEYALPIAGLNETCTLAIKQGERVLKGQALTLGLNKGYLPCHAPTSGIFVGIEDRISNHASGLSAPHGVIQADGHDEAIEFEKAQLNDLDEQTILEKIRLSGVAGLGGAAFPSHIKLNPVSEIELVIINGVECEPYITADDRLMREKSDDILLGIDVIHRLLQPKRIVIAIEDNKPEAIEAMGLAITRSHLPPKSTLVTKIPTKYPSGGEKQLIQIIAGNEVPSGSIPAQLGILVHNVATTYALAQAVREGKPLIERVVTLTGEGVKNPGNFWVPIGTPVQHLLEHGLIEPDVNQVICGGPMMGHTLASTQVPIAKGSNCILVPSANELAPEQPEKACIRCGECAQVCPAQLLPQQLFWHSKAGEYDKAASYNLRDCIECGSCSYVCPSDIPLVEYYRIAKSALRLEEEEKSQAERAKVRFEARLARLEEEKQARETKAKQAAERRQKSMTGSEKDKVAEAMARIQAKKKAQENQVGDTSTEENNQTGDPAKAGVAAAVARAKAKKAAQKASQSPNSERDELKPSSNDEPESKQDKVAAAIARAKAKKAAQAQSTAGNVETSEGETASTPNTANSASGDDKKTKIAAAVARAKAKKAAQAKQSEPQVDVEAQIDTGNAAVASTVTASEAPNGDDKKAKIAAAIARAKAKKTVQAKQSEPQVDVEAQTDAETQTDTGNTAVATTTTVSETLNGDDKKAKIAAAIARAKAKKAVQAKQADKLADMDIATKAEAEVDIDSISKAPTLSAEETTANDDKKARIAAAVARAKAKKAKKLSQGDD